MAANTVCLLNDSFPPVIDGVANVVVNYARILNEGGSRAVVATPDTDDLRRSVQPADFARLENLTDFAVQDLENMLRPRAAESRHAVHDLTALE